MAATGKNAGAKRAAAKRSASKATVRTRQAAAATAGEAGRAAEDTVATMTENAAKATRHFVEQSEKALQETVRRTGEGRDPAGIPQAAADLLQDVNGELLGFAQHRLRANLETFSRLSGCRDIGDVVDVQRVWLDTAMKDYREETRTLWEKSLTLWQQGWQVDPDVSRGDKVTRNFVA